MAKEHRIMIKDPTEAQRPVEWQDRFREIYEQAVAAYKGGVRGADQMFSAETTAFLAFIGGKPQELYDFVEDWCEVGEPSFETVLEITAVRHDFFLQEQRCEASSNVISADSFPSPETSLGGLRWLPRIIAKTRAQLHGELPHELMYGCGADRPFLKRVGIHPADFLRLVWEAGGDDQKILTRVEESAKLLD